MKTPAPPGAPPRFAVVVMAIARLARGKKDGLSLFANTPQAVLAALTPLLAFLLVGGLVALFGSGGEALEDVGAVTIGLLGPLVMSYEVARRWDRSETWPRFAVAFLWCQWAAPVLLAAVLIVTAMLMAGGLNGDTAAGCGVALLFGYGLWLHWFLARHALNLSRLRAAALVMIVNTATMAMIILPQAAGYWLNGPPAS